VLQDASPSNEIPSFQELPSRCWSSDGSRFFFTTAINGISSLMEMAFNSGEEILLISKINHHALHETLAL
jgi:hypothetical protein